MYSAGVCSSHYYSYEQFLSCPVHAVFHVLILLLYISTAVCSVLLRICVFCLHNADTDENPVCSREETTIKRPPSYSVHWNCQLLALTDFLATETQSDRKRLPIWSSSFHSWEPSIMCGGGIVSYCETVPSHPLLMLSNMFFFFLKEHTSLHIAPRVSPQIYQTAKNILPVSPPQNIWIQKNCL